VYEITMFPVNASTMVLMPDSYLMFPAKLVQYMCEMQVDYMMWVASYLVTLAQNDLFAKHTPTCLKEVWFGGEVFPTKYMNYWRRHLPGARFVHCYGPTEASFACTYKIIDREFPDEEQLPIGKPFQNTRILVLNEKNEPVRGGEEGELCVLGTRLASGYYNDPEKTALAFVQNPLNTSYPEIMYRTGDIVKYLPDGDILFRGRADTLIKHLGYRIELGEVEHVINSLQIVHYACAAYNRVKQEITLFYEADAEIPVPELRRQIGTALPRYMIPTAFIRLDRLPRNTNDKIDRVALKGMLPTA
jgi:non-ribosomal peptide synthetase component F